MAKFLTGLVIAVVLLAGPAIADQAATDASYRLDVGDEIHIRVLEWRREVGEVHEWSAFNTKVKVGPSGNVSLPLLGAVKASGKTTEELAATISGDLQSSLSLAIRPAASVEIDKFRPFYILGFVNQPGEYPFRPGMTVLEAISIGGGLFRSKDRDAYLTTTGNLQVLRLQRDGLLAREARLQAELTGAAAIVIPPELQRRQHDPAVAQALQREQALFVARRNAERAQLEALDSLKTLLLSEVTSLQSKIKNADQEVTMMKKELSSTTSLVQQGLAVAPREFSLKQTMLASERNRLDLDTAVLRAREDIGKADQSIAELRNKAITDVQTEFADIEQRLAETTARMKTAELLTGREPQQAEGKGQASEYIIVRRHDGKETQIAAAEATRVEPGDTIKIIGPNED